MKTFIYHNHLGLAVIVDYTTTAKGINLIGVYVFGFNRVNAIDVDTRNDIEKAILFGAG